MGGWGWNRTFGGSATGVHYYSMVARGDGCYPLLLCRDAHAPLRPGEALNMHTAGSSALGLAGHTPHDTADLATRSRLPILTYGRGAAGSRTLTLARLHTTRLALYALCGPLSWGLQVFVVGGGHESVVVEDRRAVGRRVDRCHGLVHGEIRLERRAAPLGLAVVADLAVRQGRAAAAVVDAALARAGRRLLLLVAVPAAPAGAALARLKRLTRLACAVPVSLFQRLPSLILGHLACRRERCLALLGVRLQILVALGIWFAICETVSRICF